MKKLLLITLLFLLSGCTSDMTAKEPYPVEKDYSFDEQLVQSVPHDVTLKVYPRSNELEISFVTTYEQAAFLARNEPYLTYETVEGNFVLPKADLKIGERIEIEDNVYYGMSIRVIGTQVEWQGAPQSFTHLRFMLEDEQLMILNIGRIAFDGEARLVRTKSTTNKKLREIAQILHEKQK
ncbi:hypothetical protein MKY27_12540 [Solibacillus sp. FSL R5-0449]|uniref:hypothetical protein n=1 Tax=unclassified Solibacillus TaxID=2637870 RepID=UPI0030CD4AC9